MLRPQPLSRLLSPVRLLAEAAAAATGAPSGRTASGHGCRSLQADWHATQDHPSAQEAVRLGELVAWQSALMLLLFASREPVGGIARWVFAAALLGVAIGLIAPGASPRVQLDSWLLTTHIACSALAYGVLTLAAMQAAALWLRDRRLHSHPTPASTTDTVPLQTMERVLFQMIGLGFSLLTLSLASGLVVTQDVQAQHLTHKLVFTVVAWAVFAALLAGRWRLGWRGRTAIRWMATGYAVLGLAYFGSKWVLETLLQTHWG